MIFHILFAVLLLLQGCRSSNEQEASRIYALYFPQFHRDPINDVIWGRGFTDWTNLRRAPRFNRNNQTLLHPISREVEPHLGYYDLTQAITRKRQRELAEKYGVDGFIIHHYWFYQNESTENPPVLSRPLLRLLEDGEPNLPFALNWALDNWVNAWQGRGHAYHSPNFHSSSERHVRRRHLVASRRGHNIHSSNTTSASPSSVGVSNILYEQMCAVASDSDIQQHYRYLRQFFHHPNYIKVGGLPLFSVLRYVSNRCSNVIDRLLQLAQRDGFPAPGLHLTGGSTAMASHDLYNSATSSSTSQKSGIAPSFLPEYAAHLYYPYFTFPKRLANMPSYCAKGLFPANHTSPQYLSVMTYFDHTPRRNTHTAVIWDRLFAAPLLPAASFLIDLVTVMMYEQCCQASEVRAKGGKFVLINAWNEWAEGMVLEPSTRFAYSFLEAVFQSKTAIHDIACNWQKYDDFLRKMISY